MGFLIILAVIVLAIILMKKSTSDKNSSFEEPVKSQITFNDLSRVRGKTLCITHRFSVV